MLNCSQLLLLKLSHPLQSLSMQVCQSSHCPTHLMHVPRYCKGQTHHPQSQPTKVSNQNSPISPDDQGSVCLALGQDHCSTGARRWQQALEAVLHLPIITCMVSTTQVPNLHYPVTGVVSQLPASLCSYFTCCNLTVTHGSPSRWLLLLLL
jgi:hypothetical protein